MINIDTKIMEKYPPVIHSKGKSANESQSSSAPQFSHISIPAVKFIKQGVVELTVITV